LVIDDWEESTITDPLITNESAIKDLEIHNVGQGFGLKFNATPLMQYRRPVGGGPSGKT
jgi:hypothetical protein